jgi:hypothetical protein
LVTSIIGVQSWDNILFEGLLLVLDTVYCLVWKLFTSWFGYCTLLVLDTTLDTVIIGLNITGDWVLHGIFSTSITVQQLKFGVGVIHEHVRVKIM